jgi:hypothetical protein
MICERYWREGIVLFERGLDDPHRDGCEDCTRAHASRHELIEALPLIGAGYTGDSHWQAKVWQRIDGERPHAPWRWRWQLAGTLAAACIVALWIGRGRTPAGDVRPRVEIIERDVARRSLGAHVDDRLRVTVGESADVWIYRAGRLVESCRARQVSDRCASDAHGMVIELPLSIPGTYEVLITAAPFPLPPQGILDEDRAALESSGVSYKEDQVPVR